MNYTPDYEIRAVVDRIQIEFQTAKATVFDALIRQTGLDYFEQRDEKHNGNSATIFGAKFRSPMAIAVIGGLLVSTFLSLLFVPAFFAVIDDLRLALQRAWTALNAEANYLPEPASREPDGTPAE